MKKINLFIPYIVFVSINLFAQELDQKYLDSLPEDMRKDILEQANQRDELEKPVYRNDTSQLEKEIDDDKDDDESENRLKVFGEDFFSSYQSTFMPINEPNFDSEYILDYGDVLNIQLIGLKNSAILMRFQEMAQ